VSNCLVCAGAISIAPTTTTTIWCTDWPHIQYRKRMLNDAELHVAGGIAWCDPLLGAVYYGTIPRLIDTVVVPRAGDGVALALFRSDRAGPHSLVADNENDLPGYG
jgi:hypothetical protein